ncbi:hypothetical protein Tco_0602503 [Tanacetum coccineum]
MNANTASTSGSGSLPSNTVANPRSDLKAITTRSGVSYDGPQVPPSPSSLPNVVEHEPKVTKDTVQPSTENIQPPKVQNQNDEPIVAPKNKPTIPYPSRINKEKLREKDNLLALKFIEIFWNLHFELSFTDALLHMPKFAPMFRKLLNNKDKIIDLIKTRYAKLRLLRWILLLQEFDVIIRDKQGAKNLAADHLSRLENPHQSDIEKKEITKTFPLETLGMVTFRGDWSDVFMAKKPLISSRLAIMNPPGDIMVPTTPLKKSLIPVSIGLLFTEMPMTWSHGVTLVNVKAKSRNMMKCLKMQFKFARSLTYGASILWDRSRLLEGTSTFSWPSITYQNRLKQKRSSLTMPELLLNS